MEGAVVSEPAYLHYLLFEISDIITMTPKSIRYYLIKTYITNILPRQLSTHKLQDDFRPPYLLDHLHN